MATEPNNTNSSRSWLHLPAAFIWAIAALLSLISCGNDGTFRINGRIDNYGTGNLRVVYYSNGAVQSVVAPSVDGKFSMTGRLDRPALARIYTGNGTIVGRFIVKPGETIEGEFDISDPTVMKFDGDDDSKRLAKFIEENASLIKNSDSKALNEAIGKYVRDNTGRLLSGVLMADYFDFRGNEQTGAELIGLLSDNVVAAASLNGLIDLTRTLSLPTDSMRIEPFTLFGSADSLSEINPQKHDRTLLMFTDASSRKTDSVTAALKVLATAAKNGKLFIADISCDPDTASWRASFKEAAADSLKKSGTSSTINSYWTPAPFNIMGLEEIPVASVPWFVVADSTRHVLYCGPSVTAARNAAK